MSFVDTSIDKATGPKISDMLAGMFTDTPEEKQAKAKLDTATATAEEGIKTGREQRNQQYGAILAEKPPTPPALEDAPEKPPAYQSDSPLKNFGGLATIIGVFGGMLTRQPLVASLKAASSAMSAYHSRNLEDYQQAVEEWKTNADYTSKLVDWRLKAYEAASKQYGDNVAAHQAAIQAIAANTQDDVTLQTLAQKGYAATIDHIDKQRDALLKWDETKSRIEQTAAQQEETMRANKEREAIDRETLAADPQKSAFDQFKRENPNATAEDMAKFVAKLRAGTSPQSIALQTFLDENPNATAQDIAGFLQRMRQPRSPQAMAMQKYMEENPNATAEDISNFGADYRARSAAVQAFATGKQGDIVRSFNVSTEHLGTLSKLADALDNGDMKGFNRVANAWATQFGGTAPNNFETAKQIVGNELIKAIVGAGGGVGDRDKAQAVLDAALTPQQLKEAITTIKSLISGQLVGLKKQYEDTTGRNDFDNRLTGPARDMLGGGKKTYQKGDIIHTEKGDYRVTGGDPNDPDVEPVK